MKPINLLPTVERRNLKLQFLSNRLLVFWFWIIATLLVFFFLSLLTRFYIDRQISATEGDIAQNKALLDSADYKDLQDQILLFNRNIKEIKNLQNQHYYWSNALVELANLVPTDMQLNQVAFDKGTGAIVIKGQAKTRESVIAFWSNVIKSEFFKNINFPLENLEKAEFPEFTYTFYVNPDKFKTE
jgi:Tfp pilus assembly protein PilN